MKFKTSDIGRPWKNFAGTLFIVKSFDFSHPWPVKHKNLSTDGLITTTLDGFHWCSDTPRVSDFSHFVSPKDALKIIAKL